MSGAPTVGVTVLGSTGTIGVNTLDVIARYPQRYRVVALTAHRQLARMIEQCARFRPAFAVMVEEDMAQQLADALRSSSPETQVLSGIEGLERVAAHRDTDYVMAAIVGAAGLRPTLAAARAGKRILLANKESLVMSGAIFMDEVRNHNAVLLPIDSEHNAIFQCMPAGFERGLSRVGVRKILLTASGGPFRTLPLDALASVTPAQACAHPNWVMGRKISVDSATMMNKGLEVIEACWLFNTDADKVEVVVHPQSIIHSMVQYVDGSVLAQLGNPDMRTPIAHALAWPARIESGVQDLAMTDVARLDFEAPSLERFPCLRLTYEALAAGGTASAVLNAANEVAVENFLLGQIAYTDIARLIETVLSNSTIRPADDLDTILAADQEARVSAFDYVGRKVKH